MNRSSYFIKNIAMFGSYPDQTSVGELEKQGVVAFVNLTYDYEKKIKQYVTTKRYIHFPIHDMQVPKDSIVYAKFIMDLTHIIKSLASGERMYIHCKGGHGRSGIVVASILCYMFSLSPQESIDQTTKYHSNRIVMRDKWRTIGSPQTYHQKEFIYKFFSGLKFYKACSSGTTAGFSNFTHHTVPIIGMGVFPSSESAFQALKDHTNEDYVNKHLSAPKPLYSKILGGTVVITNEWMCDRCDDSLFIVLKSKFDTHTELKDNLLTTGLRPIIYHTKHDSMMGDGVNENGFNKLGNALTRLREHYYKMY